VDIGQDIISELTQRINADLDAFGRMLPETYAFAWYGYLTGLRDWQVVTSVSYHNIVDLLGPTVDTARSIGGCAEHQRLNAATGRSIQAQLEHCIRLDLARTKGGFEESDTLMWSGYLAGLLEWGVLDSPLMHRQLQELLPPRSYPDPIRVLLLGRITVDELLPDLQHDILTCGGRLSDRYAVAWKAYLAGLFECDAITHAAFHRLLGYIPMIVDPDPVEWIVLNYGRLPKNIEHTAAMELESGIQQGWRSVPSGSTDRYSIAWKAYLRGLADWEVISAATLEKLVSLLPQIAQPEPRPARS
jgi:hypothetical protein